MEKIDTLVVTATLGDRISLDRTLKSVNLIGKDRVKHIIVAPAKECDIISHKYPNLEVIPEPDKCNGIYPALNSVFLKYAKDYKYLSFLNDDDYWLPDYNKLFIILDNNSEIDVAYGRVFYIDENNKLITEQTSSSRYKSFKSLLSKGIILFTQQAVLMRSELFLKIGGFDESYKLIADTNFWLKAIDEQAKFQYSNTICAAYTIQQGQLSSNGKLQKAEHERLLNNYKSNSACSFVNKVLFRLTNISIYAKRYIINRKFKRMDSLFQK